MWSGKLARYDHIKVFGCVAYAHINEEKLESRTIRYIFISYPEDIKGYKLQIDEPGRQKCIISRDVVFNKSQMASSMKNALVVEKQTDLVDQ